MPLGLITHNLRPTGAGAIILKTCNRINIYISHQAGSRVEVPEAPEFWYFQTTLETVPSSHFYRMTLYLEIMFFVIVNKLMFKQAFQKPVCDMHFRFEYEISYYNWFKILANYQCIIFGTVRESVYCLHCHLDWIFVSFRKTIFNTLKQHNFTWNHQDFRPHPP
jgi:hypothetical protein